MQAGIDDIELIRVHVTIQVFKGLRNAFDAGASHNLKTSRTGDRHRGCTDAIVRPHLTRPQYYNESLQRT